MSAALAGRRVLLGAVVLAGAVYAGHVATGPVRAPIPSAVCEEDQPCWNCATMGNRICGADYGDLIRYVPGVVDLPDSWPCYVRGVEYTCQDVTR